MTAYRTISGQIVADHRADSADLLRSAYDVVEEVADTLGDFAGDFNLAAIADEAYTLAVPLDESGHVDGAPRYVCVVDDVEFYEIVKRHDIS